MATIFQFKRRPKREAKKPFKRVLPQNDDIFIRPSTPNGYVYSVSEMPMDLFNRGFWVFLRRVHGMVMYKQAAEFHSQPRENVILAKLGHYDYWAKEFPIWWERYVLEKSGFDWRANTWMESLGDYRNAN